MMNDVNPEILARYAPRPGRHALLPKLTPQQQVALLCRVLHREGYNDHIAGHITLRQEDGTYLANPWELTWAEVKASDILRLTRKARSSKVNGTSPPPSTCTSMFIAPAMMSAW